MNQKMAQIHLYTNYSLKVSKKLLFLSILFYRLALKCLTEQLEQRLILLNKTFYKLIIMSIFVTLNNMSHIFKQCFSLKFLIQ